MQPVLFIIFFSDFVTPQKRTMPEGCCLFTLKMTVQNLGNRDFTVSWFQPNVDIDEKKPNRQYPEIEAKIEKSKTTLLFQIFEVAENKVHLFFSFFKISKF